MADKQTAARGSIPAGSPTCAPRSSITPCGGLRSSPASSR
jgi:hypothetical protein